MKTETLVLGNDDGGIVTFEVEEIRRGPQHVSTGAVGVARKSFREIIDEVAPLTKQIVDSFSSNEPSLESIEVEMGIKVSGEAGAIIAKVATEGNFILKMKWVPSKSS